MNVPTFNEIWDRILSKKIIQKNQQYGDSILDPALIFNQYEDNQVLINIRLDDKLSRISKLNEDDPKYWSEIEEIIAYLMWKLYMKEEAERGNNRRQSGDKEQSSRDIREICNDYLPFLGLRRLPGGQRRSLREEDFQ